MTAPMIAASALPTRAGAAPAGLNEAQLLVLKRLDTMRDQIAALPPLDPDWLATERHAEQHARLNGTDL